ncbi:MAG: alkene reductase [Micrococcales bacterium 73-13]|nr:MAG: alkene reductase [Micrococcales bacterium 73-13]
MISAFEPYDLGGTTLQNRIAMAPMTRTRATGSVPNEMMAEYYGQRAGAGLIITEGIAPSDVGRGYPDTPGLWNDEQVAGWRLVTDAVHARGGRIFAQLMHVGRIGDPTLHEGEANVVAPSPVAAEGAIYTHSGPTPYVVPDELDEAGIAKAIGEYAHAARNAIAAGFDGVELHGANGYLIHQFLSASANHRTDGWGVTVAGKIRFAVAAVKATAEAIGANRVGIRLSPGNPLHSIQEVEREELYLALVEALAPLGIAYVHVNEGPELRPLTEAIRAAWPQTLLLKPWTATRRTDASDLHLLTEEVPALGRPVADVLAFGANFIGNPDLVERMRLGLELNELRPQLFYGIGAEGYVDYPTAS